MESISEQSVVEMGGRGSVLARQKRDHVKLDRLLAKLIEVPVERQRAILLEIYRLVFPHAFAEESVLWPVMRRMLPDGHALTLQVELEHQQINELVARLEALEPGSPAHRQVLARVTDLLREDVREEEDELLPRLQSKLTGSQLRLLGAVWEIVRTIAPTRAHPIVSRRPPGNVLSALPLALLDRCRDVTDARIQRRGAASTPSLRRLSSALARLTHAIEQLPGMGAGEAPATRIPRKNASARGAAVLLAVGVGSATMILAARRRGHLRRSG